MNLSIFPKLALVVVLGTCGLISASTSYKNPEVDSVMIKKAIEAMQNGTGRKIAHTSADFTGFTEHYTFPHGIIDYNTLFTSVSLTKKGHATVTLRGPVAKAPAVIQEKIPLLDRWDTIKAGIRTVPFACLTDGITWRDSVDQRFECTLNFEFEASKKSVEKSATK